MNTGVRKVRNIWTARADNQHNFTIVIFSGVKNQALRDKNNKTVTKVNVLVQRRHVTCIRNVEHFSRKSYSIRGKRYLNNQSASFQVSNITSTNTHVPGCYLLP